ncbi:MAG: archease [Sedimentisphaerales bacterium]|nr:archease [Sedimentisphaerales bacterium]
MQDDKRSIYWEHFEHKADIGVRGVGMTKAQAFEQAALALTAVITDLTSVEPKEKVEIACEAVDDDLLLIEWLSSLLFEMDCRKMLFSRFEVHIEQQRLRGVCWGEKIDVERHQPAVEVKGATYMSLSVKQNDDGKWIAQCVVDV